MISKQPDILEALRRAESYLTERGVPNTRRNAEWILAHVLGCRSPELYLDPNRLLAQSEIKRFDELVQRRGAREPLQYVLGSTEFMSLTFDTMPGVFVPRPDTEVLVERVEELLASLERSRGDTVLDLCCGTGVIVVSLLCRYPELNGVGVDIDEDAVKLTERNALRNGVGGRIQCLQADAIDFLKSNSVRYPVVTCNPPYVESGEIEKLPPEIHTYEPARSLDGGSDGLDFYRRVIPLLGRAVQSCGIVALEIGDTQGGAVAGMLGASGFEQVRIHKDYGKLDRVVTARNQ
ncbi:MAG: peptide chain release factor N(5)-glutamine methyltransferase [Candidatus Latescibacterota bacterium]|nr:MAG: peptide chain release factor N(5)-glutamine methyltransferase [Candidatus Latescibacterota bacterium]